MRECVSVCLLHTSFASPKCSFIRFLTAFQTYNLYCVDFAENALFSVGLTLSQLLSELLAYCTGMIQLPSESHSLLIILCKPFSIDIKDEHKR